jgi:cysteine desulfurase
VPEPTRHPIYLDHHATTPVDPRVLEEMLPFFTERWGNASSKDHRYGADAREAVDDARQSIARVIGARPDGIVFTSGATEANNLALAGVVRAAGSKVHIITSAIEHRAVLDCLEAFDSERVAVTVLPPDRLGRIDPELVEAAIRPETGLVSIMAANNEVGTVQQLGEIGEITRARGILLHTDAAQAFGHLELDVRDLKIDLLSASAHKFYGPKGVGFLYVSRRQPRVKVEPIIRGGGHEGGMRSGTLNVPGIVGMAAAARLAEEARPRESLRLRELTEYMAAELEDGLGGVTRYGHPDHRLPHNLNVGFEGVRSKALVVNLPDLAFSTGSACTTAKAQPSHVLQALGLSEERVREAVRFGLGRSTTREHIDYAVERICEVVTRLRAARPRVA